MRRDTIDLSDVPPRQQATHEALLEWARWCGTGRRGYDTHPMFRGYVPYLYPEAQGGGVPVDILLAVSVQRAYTAIPEKHRLVLRWWYCYPFINAGRIQRGLGLTRSDLAQMVVDSRAMVGNNLRKSDPATAVTPACAGVGVSSEAR